MQSDLLHVGLVGRNRELREEFKKLLLSDDGVWLDFEISEASFFTEVLKQSKVPLVFVVIDGDSERLASYHSVISNRSISVVVAAKFSDAGLESDARRSGALAVIRFPWTKDNLLRILKPALPGSPEFSSTKVDRGIVLSSDVNQSDRRNIQRARKGVMLDGGPNTPQTGAVVEIDGARGIARLKPNSKSPDGENLRADSRFGHECATNLSSDLDQGVNLTSPDSLWHSHATMFEHARRQEVVSYLRERLPKLPPNERSAVEQLLGRGLASPIDDAFSGLIESFGADSSQRLPTNTEFEESVRHLLDANLQAVSEFVSSRVSNARTQGTFRLILDKLRSLVGKVTTETNPIITMAPEEFFAFFDREHPRMSHHGLTEVVQQWLCAQEGKDFGSFDANKAFADGVQHRARQLGMAFRCTRKLEEKECGQAATFYCQRTGKVTTGVFGLRHTYDGKQTRHLGAKVVPQLLLIPLPKK